MSSLVPDPDEQLQPAAGSFAIHALTTEPLLECPSSLLRVMRCALPAPFLVGCRRNLLREWDLHPRSFGYEPNELLLLYPAKLL